MVSSKVVTKKITRGFASLLLALVIGEALFPHMQAMAAKTRSQSATEQIEFLTQTRLTQKQSELINLEIERVKLSICLCQNWDNI